MTYATLIKVHDPYHPMKGREIAHLSCAGPISACAPDTDKPFIIMRNGETVLKKDWAQPVERDDLIAVVMLPKGGGGGSNPLKTILMLSVAYFTPYIADKAALAIMGGAASVGGLGVTAWSGIMSGIVSASGPVRFPSLRVIK